MTKTKTKIIRPRPRPRPVWLWDRSCHKTAVWDWHSPASLLPFRLPFLINKSWSLVGKWPIWNRIIRSLLVLNILSCVSPSVESRSYWMRQEVTARESAKLWWWGTEAVRLTVVWVSLITDTLRGISGTTIPITFTRKQCTQTYTQNFIHHKKNSKRGSWNVSENSRNLWNFQTWKFNPTFLVVA